MMVEIKKAVSPLCRRSLSFCLSAERVGGIYIFLAPFAELKANRVIVLTLFYYTPTGSERTRDKRGL
jgi:hypothetical protein